MWWGHMDGDWGWWMLAGWLWMVAFWGLVIWGIVVLVQRFGGGQEPKRGDDDPLTILQRRYASGEIDTEEFDRMRQRLREDRG